MTKVYAGIGSRETPTDMLKTMTLIGVQLAEAGWLLRSGHARGADQAFQRGAPDSRKEIHLPWDGYNHGRTENPMFVCPKPNQAVVEIAARYHPAWDKLSQEAKLFMVRNVTIVLGLNLLSPAKMIICWTPRAQITGGTGHAMRVAHGFDIPVFNIASPEDQIKLCEYAGAFYEPVEPDTPISVA
jgi:hypothetical protein